MLFSNRYRVAPKYCLSGRGRAYIRIVSISLVSLRSALAQMPPGTLVPRDWLLEQLSDPLAPESEYSTTLIDLTIQDLAERFGKRPSTLRAWVERGDFPGAYKLHGKEWRVPRRAVEDFQVQQRAGKRRS